MIEQHEQLDDALGGRDPVLTPEIQALVDLAAEVARSLDDWRMSPIQRARVRSRVFDLVQPGGLPVWRRLALRRRAPTLIGGAAAITVAAAVGIGVAVARGRRHEQALAA
jgi:hypothetical protein